MTCFIPASSAELLSVALWGLARPPATRSEKDTQSLFPWVTVLDGSLWLMVDTGYQITVHPDAVLGNIAAILQPFIENNQLPETTNAQLAALIESKRGQKLAVYEAFPALFKLKSMENPTGLGRTREQMIQEKRLPNPILP